ncbi:MAG: hypothetical protein J0L63_08250 [Anaerolineae bacterium]|nr:hypothetical protein [Anaerolineae bacterium]MBN8618882.1 hypothetical protein [Anaerolineae bacterium]
MASLGSENVKLIMRWDIKSEREQDYFEFVVREWVPGITRMGMEPTGAWFTAYSHTKQSQIMTEGLVEDIDTMRRILSSAEWLRLHNRLLDYVSNYEQKVVRVTGDFQF